MAAWRKERVDAARHRQEKERTECVQSDVRALA